MKNLTNYFMQKGIIFKHIEKVEPKVLNSKKKIEIYCSTSLRGEYYAIFIINAKSRFVKKSAEELLEFCENLAKYKEHNFRKKILLISSPICSKAKELLKQNGWSVKNDFNLSSDNWIK